jgi:hypothetical protein
MIVNDICRACFHEHTAYVVYNEIGVGYGLQYINCYCGCSKAILTNLEYLEHKYTEKSLSQMKGQ